MHEEFLDLLVDPATRARLLLDVTVRSADGEVVEADLRAPSGVVFPVRGGVPRFVTTDDEGQRQTGRSFGFKWGRRDSYESAARTKGVADWMLARYGFATVEAMRAHFAAGRFVLDAGCGAGMASSVWLEPGWSRAGSVWVGADISEAIDVAAARLSSVEGTHFVQADLMTLPFAPATFDRILCEGVLHHTPSTERAFEALVELLAPGGELAFYVYRKKAPVREFTDDYVRERIAGLPPEEAWEAMKPLTRLAGAIAAIDTTVHVEEDEPLLGIPKGEHSLQRLVYWYFAKLFWNPEYSFDENHHINFDWYHPRYAHRHTRPEVEGWCRAAGMDITHLDEQEAGITVRAVRR